MKEIQDEKREDMERVDGVDTKGIRMILYLVGSMFGLMGIILLGLEIFSGYLGLDTDVSGYVLCLFPFAINGYFIWLAHLEDKEW